jgi:predicted nucleic acid-binding protein
VVIRHLTGDPPEMAARATAALVSQGKLVLTDVVVAECIYVLRSVYAVDRTRVAELMRAALALPTIATANPALLLRALQVYELERVGFADAYLIASAEATGIPAILSFDRDLDRVATVTRLEP